MTIKYRNGTRTNVGGLLDETHPHVPPALLGQLPEPDGCRQSSRAPTHYQYITIVSLTAHIHTCQGGREGLSLSECMNQVEREAVCSHLPIWGCPPWGPRWDGWSAWAARPGRRRRRSARAARDRDGRLRR